MENFVFTLIDTSDSTKLYSSHGHVHIYLSMVKNIDYLAITRYNSKHYQHLVCFLGPVFIHTGVPLTWQCQGAAACAVWGPVSARYPPAVGGGSASLWPRISQHCPPLSDCPTPQTLTCTTHNLYSTILIHSSPMNIISIQDLLNLRCLILSRNLLQIFKK